VNRKEEVILARKEEELAQEHREGAKSFYYPPEEDEEPQEIRDMEERFQKAKEQNGKIFGEPVFEHTSGTRGFAEQAPGEQWDMLVEAKPLDVDHRVDEDTIDNLLVEIVEHPPELPREKVLYGEAPGTVIAPGEGKHTAN
jgi:hypothetical protein